MPGKRNERDPILGTEAALWQRRRDDILKKCEDQFVLIKGEDWVGGFSDERSAYRAGLEEFGNCPFLIRLVTKAINPSHTFLPVVLLGVYHVDR